MNLPNKLTLLRIILVPFILLFLLPVPFMTGVFASWNEFVAHYGHYPAAFLFVVASFTDLLDGRIARSRGLVTNLGKFLDPIADKMLVISVLTVLVQQSRIHSIIAIIIIVREFVVTGIRLIASDRGKVIAASNLGKTKTVLQMIAITYMMLEKTILALAENLIGRNVILAVGDIAMAAAVVLTIYSGYDYVIKNMSFLKDSK